MNGRLSPEGALLILVSAIVSLGFASSTWILAAVALFFCLLIYRRLRMGKIPVLRRVWLYAGIVPFAIWFAAYPNPPGGFSPLFFCIPAWYLLYLALVEWRSVGRGGKDVFVLFDALAAVLLGTFEWSVSSLLAGAVAFAAFLFEIRPRKKIKSGLLFWLASLLLTLLALGGIWQMLQSARASWGKSARSMAWRQMGFSTVGELGSFAENYSGSQEGAVVLRIYSPRRPVYFKGISYGRYLPGKGLWKKWDVSKQLQTGPFVGNYGGFESGIPSADSNPVWVRSSLVLRNVLFAPPGAAGVAVKEFDSIPYFAGDFFSVEGNMPGDWYYWDGVRSRDLAVQDTLWTAYPKNLEAFLDSAVVAMALDDSPDSLFGNLQKMKAYFQKNYSYSLRVPLSGSEDPLRTFVRMRSGFCEYFASFGTLLLRRLGVQARYTTGFAYPEKMDDYWIFCRRNAHAWIEFRDADGYWNIFDPTPVSVRALGKELSFFGMWWERIRGNGALFWHRLTEGSWRESVDAFGTWTGNFVRTRLFWVILGLSISGGILGWAVRNILRRRKKFSASEQVLRWQLLLFRAEKSLASQGFVRKRGETVNAFFARIPKNAKTEKALNWLLSYNSGRWKKL